MSSNNISLIYNSNLLILDPNKITLLDVTLEKPLILFKIYCNGF